VYLA